MIVTTLYFLIVTICLGFIIDLFIKNWKAGSIEKLVIRLGVGTAFFTILGVVLAWLRIPLDWRVYLLIGLAILITAAYLRGKKLLGEFEFKNFSNLKKNIALIFVIIMFILTLYMYMMGTYSYPWFEDGDPYGYAMVSKYIAEEKTILADEHFGHYAEPYTQGYQIFMGVLHQLNDSIYNTLKFFNALIISLSILWFYYFARRFTKNEYVSFISTLALFSVPAWLSHFVFSLNFNMALLPLFFYSLVSIDSGKKWKFVTVIVLGSIMVNHFNTGVTIFLIAILYYLNKIFVEERLNISVLHSIVGGFLLSLVYFIPAYARHSDLIGESGGLGGAGRITGGLQEANFILVGILFIIFLAFVGWLTYKGEKVFKPIKRILQIKNIKPKIFGGVLLVVMLVLILPSERIVDLEGTATRDYTLKDFFIAPENNMINNPIGLGVVLMLLFCLGVGLLVFNYKNLFEKENFWLSTNFIWSIFAILVILGTYFSIVYIPFRMWTYFGLFSALMVGFAFNTILKNFKSHYIKILCIGVLVLLLLPTAFHAKFEANTTKWPEHRVMVPSSQDLYVWMRDSGEIPKDSHVYPLCNHNLMYGYDMNPIKWKIERGYYRDSLNKSLEDNYKFLKENNMEYVVLGASCVASNKVDQELLTNRITEMRKSNKFSLVESTKSEFLFRIRNI